MKVLTTLTTIAFFVYLGLCEVRTATTYRPPYLPTKCFGSDQDQFPASNFFAAAGPAIWNSGAKCGIFLTLTCKSTGGSGVCTGKEVKVKIVDGRLGPRAPDCSLSMAAAAQIYTGGGKFNVECARGR